MQYFLIFHIGQYFLISHMRIKKSNFLNFSKIIIHIHTCYDKSELHISIYGTQNKEDMFLLHVITSIFRRDNVSKIWRERCVRTFVPRVTMIN